MNKFTKADIVDAIYNKTGTNRKEIRDVVDFFIDEIKSALVSGKVIELRGFGTFEIKIRKGRQKARNPKTGEIFSVNSHGIAAFRSGRELRQAVWTLKDEAPESPAGQPDAGFFSGPQDSLPEKNPGDDSSRPALALSPDQVNE